MTDGDDDVHLRRLVELMPPGPLVERPTTWAEAEATLGAIFPPSYRRFVETYGAGTIEPELVVLDPRDTTVFAGWLRASTGPIDDIPWEELRSSLPPHHGHPGPGPRLVTVGGNGCMDSLYLVVRDGVGHDEDDVWVGNLREAFWQALPGPFCRAVLDLVTGATSLGDDPDAWMWRLEPVWTPAPADAP